ncbi:MAG: amidohydrolase family protein, partial [Clostridia bacterium]|nr:amidohydrolase family protein [Clostridia bacterium]
MKDLLIKNAHIIGADEIIIEDGCMVIEQGRFEYVGAITEEIEKLQYDKVINAQGKIAAPGLVNAHTHSPMVLLRNYANDYPIQKWLFDYIIPAENKLSSENIYWGAQLAVAEMIQSGTTAFLDMYLYMEEVAKVVAETGIKACLSKDIIKSKV